MMKNKQRNKQKTNNAKSWWDMVELELSSTVDENGQEYNHFDKQFASFVKSETYTYMI